MGTPEPSRTPCLGTSLAAAHAPLHVGQGNGARNKTSPEAELQHERSAQVAALMLLLQRRPLQTAVLLPRSLQFGQAGSLREAKKAGCPCKIFDTDKMACMHTGWGDLRLPRDWHSNG